MITTTKSADRKGWFTVYCEECQDGRNGSSAAVKKWAKNHKCR